MSAQEDYQSVADMADRLGLEDDEAESFISSAMKRLGHKARLMWEDGEGDSGKGGGDFFSSKRREQRPTRSERGRRGGSGWQYRDAG